MANLQLMKVIDRIVYYSVHHSVHYSVHDYDRIIDRTIDRIIDRIIDRPTVGMGWELTEFSIACLGFYKISWSCDQERIFSP